MALVNEHFLKLQSSYLFSDIAKKVNSFKVTHPKSKIIRMGIGDVTQPLAPAVIEASIRPWMKWLIKRLSMDMDPNKDILS